MIEMNPEAAAFLSEFGHDMPQMADGGQPDGMPEHPDDKLMAHMTELTSGIDRILSEGRAKMRDLPESESKGLRPALSARGDQRGVEYGAGMTVPMGEGELTLKGIGNLERRGKTDPHSLEAEYRHAALRALLRHNPKTRESALELTKRLPKGELTAGMSQGQEGERAYKLGYRREFGKGGAAKKAFSSAMSEVNDMVGRVGGEGRTSIVPVPNRWFLQPDKFPGQQKLVERVLAMSGKERADFPSGAFINPRTGEIMDGRIMDDVGVVIDPKTNRPMMSAGKESGLEVLDPKTGSYTKSNLVRKGLFKPEGGDPMLNDLNFLATIEKGDVGHKYGMATEYATPTELYNTMSGANPTLRPRSRGDLFGMGDVVGRVRVGRSDPHDVYEKLMVAPKGSDVPGVKLSKAHGGLAHMAAGGKTVLDKPFNYTPGPSSYTPTYTPTPEPKYQYNLTPQRTQPRINYTQPASTTRRNVTQAPTPNMYRRYAEGGDARSDEGAAFGVYPQIKAKRAGKSDIGDKIVDTLFVPHEPLDLALMVLPFGKVGKLAAAAIMAGAPGDAEAGKVKKIIEAAKNRFGKSKTPPAQREYTPEEKAVLEKWGQKQEQEAARAKKVGKMSDDSVDDVAQSSSVGRKSKGPRNKVEADYYRQMAEQQGEEAVLRAARAGKHLKPTKGGYVGAPRTVTSGQGLGGMRKGMDTDFTDAVDAVKLADPERMGTWYDRAKQGIAATNEPYQLNRGLEQHGVYSAGVSPESELGFSLKHLNSRVAGEPAMAYRGAPMRTLDSAVAGDRPANMGFKIGEYANKNDPRLANEGLFGVNDFRRAQGMGYTDPAGKPWKAGVTEQMHPFMDAETALQVERANKNKIGGRENWAGPQIQEVPWVYGKGQDLHLRGKDARYKGDRLEGVKQSLRDANNTAEDYMHKHIASATHEAIPGVTTGHVPSMLNAPMADKIAYGNKGRWDVPAPESKLNEFPEVGAGRRDSLYGALGYRQAPTMDGVGAYFPEGSKIAEHNPVKLARVLADFPTGGGGLASPLTQQTMNAVERFRALTDAQAAYGFNLPNTMGAVKGKNSLVMDTRGRNPNRLKEPYSGMLPDAKQMEDMTRILGDVGYGVAPTSRGATVFPFDSKATADDLRKMMKSKKSQLEKSYPSMMEPSLNTSGFGPGVGKYTVDGFTATEPYSGDATKGLLKELSYLPEDVALKLGESEDVRRALKDKIKRDKDLPDSRGDIQETRRFFAEADWPKAVALIRQGYSPAAALAALGYSASSMAGESR